MPKDDANTKRLRTTGPARAEQPAPPRQTRLEPADPETEPNPGDPGPPLIASTPQDPRDALTGVPGAEDEET